MPQMAVRCRAVSSFVTALTSEAAHSTVPDTLEKGAQRRVLFIRSIAPPLSSHLVPEEAFGVPLGIDKRDGEEVGQKAQHLRPSETPRHIKTSDAFTTTHDTCPSRATRRVCERGAGTP